MSEQGAARTTAYLTTLSDVFAQSTPMLTYGEDWRVHRRLQHSALGPPAVKQYQIVQEDLAALMAKQFLDKPEGFIDHVRLWVSLAPETCDALDSDRLGQLCSAHRARHHIWAVSRQSGQRGA